MKIFKEIYAIKFELICKRGKKKIFQSFRLKNKKYHYNIYQKDEPKILLLATEATLLIHGVNLYVPKYYFLLFFSCKIWKNRKAKRFNSILRPF